MKILITAAVFSALALTPASAKTKAAACSGEDMAKTSAAMQTRPYTQGTMAMNKEMGMVNTEMSKGNMRGACTHYMKAQRMSSAK